MDEVTEPAAAEEPALARLAHSDAWQVLGRIHERSGRGAVAVVPGGSLMASGLPHPQYNNADVLDVDAFDVERAVAWYGEHGVPWGVRVPAGAPWPHGRRLFEKRLMELPAGRLQRSAVTVDQPLTIVRARERDLSAVVGIDVDAFGGSAATAVEWLGPLVGGSDEVVVALALWDGEPAGTGYAVLSDGAAGPAAHLGGIGVAPGHRRRGIGAALSAWLVDQAGGRFVHLHAATDGAARLYRRLGLVEAPGLDVYVDIATP